MLISLIVATDENGLIGKDGGLPWRLPADLKYFKKTTLGKPVVMGRKTWESIARPLPGRKNIVLTTQKDYLSEGVEVVQDVAAALSACGAAGEVMVIGGRAVYALFLPQADRLYLTRVHAQVEGDVYFPTIDAAEWKEVARTECEADENNEFALSFLTLERN